MRCTMQNTRHSSADILPWPLLPILGGAGEHQEGNVVFSISSQIVWSLDFPRTRVFPRVGLACFAKEKRTGSGALRFPTSSVIPSLNLYHGVLVFVPTYKLYNTHRTLQGIYQLFPTKI